MACPRYRLDFLCGLLVRPVPRLGTEPVHRDMYRLTSSRFSAIVVRAELYNLAAVCCPKGVSQPCGPYLSVIASCAASVAKEPIKPDHPKCLDLLRPRVRSEERRV